MAVIKLKRNTHSPGYADSPSPGCRRPLLPGHRHTLHALQVHEHHDKRFWASAAHILSQLHMHGLAIRTQSCQGDASDIVHGERSCRHSNSAKVNYVKGYWGCCWLCQSLARPAGMHASQVAHAATHCT